MHSCGSSLALVISASCRKSHYLSWIKALEAECGWTKRIQDIYSKSGSNVSGGYSLLEDECISCEDHWSNFSSCRDPLGWQRQRQRQWLLRMPVTLNLNPRSVWNSKTPRLSSESWHSCSLVRCLDYGASSLIPHSRYRQRRYPVQFEYCKETEETRWKLHQQTPMRRTG